MASVSVFRRQRRDNQHAASLASVRSHKSRNRDLNRARSDGRYPMNSDKSRSVTGKGRRPFPSSSSSKSTVCCTTVIITTALQAQIHKMTHKKSMKDFFKTLHRFRQVARFTPQQMRQFILGISVALHMLRRYSSRADQLNTQLQSVAWLVLIPFSIPPVLVLGIPLLIFVLPLLTVGIILQTLHRNAQAVLVCQKGRQCKGSSSSATKSRRKAMGSLRLLIRKRRRSLHKPKNDKVEDIATKSSVNMDDLCSSPVPSLMMSETFSVGSEDEQAK